MKRGLKKIRASKPFNYILTSSLRVLLNAVGLHSEFVIKHVPRVGTVRCRLPNGHHLCLWSLGDDWVSNQVYWRGWRGYEPETISIFYNLAARAGVTLDIGAHVGLFGLIAAHANPRGQVYAFEPMFEIYKRLTKNVGLNGLANVECVNTAVGDFDGEANFYHVGSGLPSSSSLSFEFMRSTPDLRSFVAPVLTVDRFVHERDLERVDLVKIDTESTEPQVLRGMLETIQRHHPSIVSEVLVGRGTEKPLEELLRPLGYRFYLLTPNGPVLRDRIEGHPLWLNYLFATQTADELTRL